MSEKTVEIDDTEVEIRETEDGFEAVEVDSGPEPGVYLRGQTAGGIHGAMVPADADFLIDQSQGGYGFAWHAEDDVSNGLKLGGVVPRQGTEYDASAWVDEFEIVVVE